jgi:hypothetical protein
MSHEEVRQHHRDSKSIRDLRRSLVIAWLFILVLILRMPDKNILDLILILIAVGSMGSIMNWSSRPGPIDFSSLPELSEQCKELAKDPKRKIEAVLLYREETGLGLQEAKAAVEAFVRSAAV